MRYLALVIAILGLLTLANLTHAFSYPSGSCVDQVCSMMSPMLCDEEHEVAPIARTCSDYGTNVGCFRFLTSKVSPFEADSWAELRPFLLACRDTWDTHCLRVFFQKLSPFELDNPAEVLRVGYACKNVPGECVKEVCHRLSAFDCDTLPRLERIAASCRH